MRDLSQWPEVELRALTESAVDGPFGSALKSEHYVDGDGVRVIRLQNVGVGVFRDDDRAYISSAYAGQLSRHGVVPGDIIVASMGDETNPVGRACQYPADGAPAIVKADCFRLRMNKSIAHPGFFRHLLNSSQMQKKMFRMAQGVTRDRINLGSLMRVTIPSPPLDEQRRIAEILDSADESIRSVERVIAKLQLCGRGLLQVTVDGLDDAGYPSSTVGNEFDIKSGITLGPHRVPRGHPVGYLRVANVQRGSIDFSDVALLEASPLDVATYSLCAGDLLVVEGHANPSEIGRCAMVREDPPPLLFQNHLFRMRPTRLDAEFALLWLNSSPTRSYWRRMCATSSGLYTINSRQLRAVPIIVPDLAEQQRIVRIARAHDDLVRGERERLEKMQRFRLGLMEDLLRRRVRVGEDGAQ